MQNISGHSAGRVCFLKVLGDFFKHLTFPKEVAVREKLFSKERVALKDQDGKIWPIKLSVTLSGNVDITQGWMEFVNSKNIYYGDTVSFEFVSDDLILVNIARAPKLDHIVEGTLDKQMQRSDMEKNGYFSTDGYRNYEQQQNEDRALMPFGGKGASSEPQEGKVKAKGRPRKRPKANHGEVVNKQSLHSNQNFPQLETTDQSGVYKKQKVKVKGGKKDRVSVLNTENGVSFALTWRKTNRLYYYLTIPKQVVTANQLASKNKIELKDQEGRTWPIKLRLRSSARVDMSQGWRDFLHENKVQDGDSLTFEFISDDMALVTVAQASRIDHAVGIL